MRLSPGEQAIHSSFFSNGENVIELKNKNHASISKAISAHKKRLLHEYSQIYFLHNRKFLYIAILISFLIGAQIILSLKDFDDKGGAIFLMFWLSVWTPVTAYLIYAWLAALKAKFTIGKIVNLPVMTVFALAWSAGEIGALVALCSIIGIVNGVMLISIFVLNTVFYFLLENLH